MMSRTASRARPWAVICEYSAWCLIWGSVAPVVLTLARVFGWQPPRALAEIVAWPMAAQIVALQTASTMGRESAGRDLAALYSAGEGIGFYLLPPALMALWLVLPAILSLLLCQSVFLVFRLGRRQGGRLPGIGASPPIVERRWSRLTIVLGLIGGLAASTLIGAAVTGIWLSGLAEDYMRGGLTLAELVSRSMILSAYARTGFVNSVVPILCLLLRAALRRAWSRAAAMAGA
jgi:hypothetical protein